ncbi:uncharacterized protein LOC133290351 [Gastrolobium bilobum]|uniref:uncharacterized protein LOC133290351 n=1 Tax=Gastrolobium bilobum TaxID=150636 RepID=UPI002AB000C9|nr:uncharacterized protein LOC133290351 [Gastrolobium bilobum]
MGCGISTFEAEDASLGHGHRSNRVRHHVIVPPVAENKKDLDNGDEGVDKDVVGDVLEVKQPLGDEKGKTKEERSNDEMLKEKHVVDTKEDDRVFERREKEKHGSDDKHAKNVKNEEEHEENNCRDDSFIGTASPSFRDYCNGHDSGDRSSDGESNDCDSRESTKNSSDDGSTNRQNKSENEEILNSNKGIEKKERSRRLFRNIMNKGKTTEKKNLLNFGCYNSSTESYAKDSFNKTIGKNA